MIPSLESILYGISLSEKSRRVVEKIDSDFRFAFGVLEDFKVRYKILREKYSIKTGLCGTIFDIEKVLREGIIHLDEETKEYLNYVLIERIEKNSFPRSVATLLEFEWTANAKGSVAAMVEATIECLPLFYKYTLNKKLRTIFIKTRKAFSTNDLYRLFDNVDNVVEQEIDKADNIDSWFAKYMKKNYENST